jgi:hypothetical protein
MTEEERLRQETSLTDAKEVLHMRSSLHANSCLAFILGALMATAVPVRASGQGAAGPPENTEMKVPQTPEEHFTRAAEYERKAKEYRQEAALHKKMLDDERKALPPKLKSGPEPGWVAKMRRHCEGYIQKAQTLAQEADQFAQYHLLRGREMQGQ